MNPQLFSAISVYSQFAKDAGAAIAHNCTQAAQNTVTVLQVLCVLDCEISEALMPHIKKFAHFVVWAAIASIVMGAALSLNAGFALRQWWEREVVEPELIEIAIGHGLADVELVRERMVAIAQWVEAVVAAVPSVSDAALAKVFCLEN